MRKHVRALPFVALLAVPVAFTGGGCSDPDTPVHPGALTHSVRQPVVGGQLETGLEATLAMMVEQGGQLGGPVCTGTMIAVDGSYGYVLTAAHCGSIAAVIQTDDVYGTCEDGGSDCRIYEVDSAQIHPSYNSDPAYDFQMLRVFGVDGSTPFVPAATSDSIGEGDAITVAGFGTYNSGSSLQDADGRKRSATNSVDFVDGLAIYFSQSYSPGNGGVCFGDSGGPTYAQVGGQMQVVGVNQAVSSDFCDDIGISGRVQAVSGFIAEFMGDVPPPVTCDQCFQLEVNTAGGECADEVEACFSNQACSDFYDCIVGCTTQVCANTCATNNPGGVDPFNAIFTCSCSACSTECAGDPSCEDPSSTAAGPGATTADAGAGVTSSAAGLTTTGEGATGVTGSGVGSGGGGTIGEDDDDDDGGDGDGGKDGGDSAASDDGGCTVNAAGATARTGARAGIWAFGLAGLALAAASRRRRA